MEQAKIQSDPFKEKFTFFCNGSKMTGYENLCITSLMQSKKL